MFDRKQFLQSILERAGSKAAIARALDIPTSRVAELYNGSRRLTMEEGMQLAETFDVPVAQRVSVASLKPVLQVCLRYAPKDGWSVRDVERLAEEIEYGLTLLQSASTTQPTQDALDVASRAIAGRFRAKPA